MSFIAGVGVTLLVLWLLSFRIPVDSEDRHHLTVIVPSATKKRMIELQKTGGYSSAAKLIQSTLVCYEMVTDTYINGGRVILEDVAGNQEEYRPFPTPKTDGSNEPL